MSTVARHSDFVYSNSPSSLTGRNKHRYTGMIVAVGASAGLWGLIGATVWGVSSLFG